MKLGLMLIVVLTIEALRRVQERRDERAIRNLDYWWVTH